MSKPVLVVTRLLPPAIEARAQREFEARLNPDDVLLQQADLLRLAKGAQAILCAPGDRLDADTVGKLPESIKAIGTFSVGYDHIDVAAARARGIGVCNTPDVLSVATAELAMSLMLAAARRLGEGERMIRAGSWTGWSPTQLLGRQVSGRRLGIFGFGRIGRELARIARAGFGMEIHYRDQVRLPPELEAGAIFHDSDESFLPICEVLSLHAPGGEGTRRWLNTERIARLPRGAVVVNAARGTLIDDAALIDALRSGQIAFAGLDVFDGEPKVNAGYLGLENVVLLPHLGSATVQTRDAMGFIALDGIISLLGGGRPKNLIV